MMREIVARGVSVTADDLLKDQFKELISSKSIVDALILDTRKNYCIGAANLPVKAPVALEIIKRSDITDQLLQLSGDNKSLLIIPGILGEPAKIYLSDNPTIENTSLTSETRVTLTEICLSANDWAGRLNENGEHIVDLRTPSPGPHYNVNLLLGNRVRNPHALQTTPKSVVDRLGRGSFRSHAFTAVLATRWDMRPEENGFPANRQFYLIENSKKLFYSADVSDPNIDQAYCNHSQNLTTITYITKCGLKITRKIFLLPQYEGLPIATEVQQILVENIGSRKRNLKIATIGMFGITAGSLVSDVVYTNVIMQSKVMVGDDGAIKAIGSDYYPAYCNGDQRFHSMQVHLDGKLQYPTEFCTNYNDLVGNGTLENPEYISVLANRHFRKGPGFFALGAPITIEPGKTAIVNTFTGLVSQRENPNYDVKKSYNDEIENLLNKYADTANLDKSLQDVHDFYKRYSSFIQVETNDKDFDSYFNKNLPFQVLYQTYVSRSFAQTQKGDREIGFREIQDIYSSLYYYVAMGYVDLSKELIKSWADQVCEFGYANHNFFWEGKQAGHHSDDALWLVQAVYRYVTLTGDTSFLDEHCKVNDKDYTRPLYDTIKSIIRYSGVVSVGTHGLPLLDKSDWNDCLTVDEDWIGGEVKERLYKEQVAKNGNIEDQPFESKYAESVMNAFLLKVAIDEMAVFAAAKNDSQYVEYLKKLGNKLSGNIQKHAWKEDFFARVLLSKYDHLKYIGAKGDGFAMEPGLEGSYFINSYGWALLADCASEDQIRVLTDTLEKALCTPYGVRLMTLASMGQVSKSTASDGYFPGDRENCAVFKHATMMMTAGMFKAAKEVKDQDLAKRLSDLAYWMIDLVLPYKALENPFVIAGNPRICTQYINSQTGENIGPLLSGTSTWLNLSLLSAFGVDCTKDGILFDPILRADEEAVSYTLNPGYARYKVKISKPKGFRRIAGGNYTLKLDGKILNENIIPKIEDGKDHSVELVFN